MKTILILAALAFAAPASAADLQLKAPRPAYAVSGSGWYFGVNTEIGVAQAKVNGSDLFATSLVNGGLTAAGGSVGGSIGYVYNYSPTNWVALQADGNWQNISANSPVAGINPNISSRWSAEVVAKVGGFPSLFDWLPDLGVSMPSLPALPLAPAGIKLASISHPYWMAGARVYDVTGGAFGLTDRSVGIAPLVGAGVITQIQNKDGVVSGAVLDTFAKVIFAGKGATFSNGKFSGSADLGTQYWAGIGIYY